MVFIIFFFAIYNIYSFFCFLVFVFINKYQDTYIQIYYNNIKYRIYNKRGKVMVNTYKSVFDTLSGVDITGYTEQKGSFTYLKWSYAEHIMSLFYPEFQVKWLSSDVLEDKTVIVKCRIEIGNLYKEGFLPVYDNKYNAIPNPNASDINDTKQRCMVKTLAKFGLGISVFHNGDTKPAKLNLYGQINDPEVKKIAKAKNKKTAVLTALKKGGLNENTSEIELGQALQSS